MKLKLLSPVICRTPLFPYTEKLENVWEELKEAINLSSSDLYEQIKDVSAADLDQLDPKIKFACWKYFNRARFRSTPFGLFGSITPVSLGTDYDNSGLIISKEIKRHEFIDWSNKDYLLNDIDNLFSQASFFLSNSTIYPCGDQLRYISIVDNTFEISGIENQSVIKSVLDFCQEKQSKNNVLGYLTQDHGLQLTVAEDLLKQLIALQLMITDIHPNIIGTDYFERMKVKPKTNSKPYLIAERKLVKGQIDPKTLKVISEAILFLKDHLPVQKNRALENFKQQFQRKFEYREVPLLMALDPELGVGYDELEIAPIVNPIINFLNERNTLRNSSSEITYTPLHQFILTKIFQNNEIQLDEFDEGVNLKSKSLPIPNTFSAIMQFNDQRIILEQAGGCTANTLLGRFTLASSEIETHCKNIVEIEQTANPEILFVDVSYQAEKNIDNINRRKGIYEYELAILNYFDTKYISFHDVLVSVRDSEVFLRSKKHNKRIIPRLTSAYNYTRSDLPIYRFLTDLQNQGLQINLSTQIKNLFPNLSHYPQLNYKNVILSSKMWKVPKQFCNLDVPLVEQLISLKTWLQEQKILSYFKCGNLDQYLYFNSSDEEDLTHFLQYCKGKDFLYIIEIFIPAETITKNEHNRSYNSEFVITLAHTSPIYSPFKKTGLELITHPKSVQLPGGEWLYFEIYMHHLRTNKFLTDILPNFLKKIKDQIKNWFFIRYNLPSSHIRLRIHKKENADSYLLISLLSDFLSKDIKDGIVTDLQIKSYFREIERYGIKTIEKVEKYFGLDSKLVLKLLHLRLEDSTLYFSTLQFISTIFCQLNLSLHEQLIYVESIADSLASEMKVDMLGFKKINKNYDSINTFGNLALSRTNEKDHLRSVTQIVKLLKSLERPRQLVLLTDLIHMHINRLFMADQRVHEMIIYQYLRRHLTVKHKHATPPI